MITFLISNVNALKAQRGATLIHMKYTREPLKYRKRTKFQKLKKKKKLRLVNYSMLLSMYEGILTSSFSAPAIHAHDN
jgi:hypothetical protein